MTRAAPLPGVLILITTPPLHLPTLLLASHIKHPLKETYPSLIAEQWSAHLAGEGIEASAAKSKPVVWLNGVPTFPASSEDDASEAEDDDGSDEGPDSEDDSQGEDQEDEDGNVWRGLKGDLASDKRREAIPILRRDGTAVANLTIGQVTYLAPIPSGTDPLLSLSFLYHLHSVLLMYFPSSPSSAAISASPHAPTPIPAAVLSSNFDLVYQLLQEMLDDGRPLTVEYNSLKDIVRGRAWWEDIMARMGSWLPNDEERSSLSPFVSEKPRLDRAVLFPSPLKVTNESDIDIPALSPLCSHSYSLSSSNPAPPPQISNLAWRPSHVRYSRNEVYVDIVESLHGVVDRKGEALGGLDLTVSIACRAKLTGTPDMTLSLHPSPIAHPNVIVGPSFHPCVRTRRWFREGVLSFIPPDGAFELAQFIVPASSALRSSKSPLANPSSTADSSGWFRDVPFTLKAKRSSVKESKGREWNFEVTLTAKSGRTGPTSSEGLEVSFHVLSQGGDDGDDTFATVNVDARTSVSHRTSLSGGGGGGSGAVASSSSSLPAGDDAGVWRFDDREGLVKWSIPRLASSSSGSGGGPSEVTLKGLVRSSSTPSQSIPPLSKPSSLLVCFSLPLGQPCLSGIRVASLHISSVDYKPFKGVRGATRGRLEWRW